jgi:hypothetical protein
MLEPLLLPPNAAAGTGHRAAAAAPEPPAAADSGGGLGEGCAWRGHGAAGRRLYAGPGWWEGPGGGGGGDAWRGWRCAALCNVATAHMLQHNLSRAHAAITRALECDPRSPGALLLAVYLEMRQGNAAAALAILKRRRAARDPAPAAPGPR